MPKLKLRKQISRKKALSILKAKRDHLIKLIKNSYNEGRFTKHQLAQLHNINQNVDLKEADLVGVYFFRKDRNCREKKYYIINAKCKLHINENSIVYVELRYINKGLNPCLLCNSNLDEIGIMAIAHNIKRNTIYSFAKNHNLNTNQIKKYLFQKAKLNLSKNERVPALRKNSHYLKNLSLSEKIEKKLLNYSENDPRKFKLLNLIKIIDIKIAKVIKENKITYVHGLNCRKHPSTPIEKKQLGRFLEGAHPCPECNRSMRSKLSKGIKRQLWTRDRLLKKIANSCILSQKLFTFDITKINISLIRKGNRNCAHVIDIFCKTHGQIVPPLLVGHFLNGTIFCPQCPSTNALTFNLAREMVFSAHQGIISLVDLGEGILKQSKFKCNLCEYIWNTPLNGVIGSYSTNTCRTPTGCPQCASISNYTENYVASILKDFNFVNCANGTNIDNVLSKLILSPKTFSRAVVIPRKGSRELKVDYMISIQNKILAIEVDGPQHYGIRYRTHGEVEYNRIHILDCQKVSILKEQYKINTCRLPLPILDFKELKNEIINIINDKPRWMGIPNKSWMQKDK